MLGLTANIFASAYVFVALFLVILLVIYLRKKDLNISSIFSKRTILVTIVFLLSTSPIFAEYFIHKENPTLAFGYSTYSHSQNFLDWIRMIIERITIASFPELSCLYTSFYS